MKWTMTLGGQDAYISGTRAVMHFTFTQYACSHLNHATTQM